jgi:glycerol-1-phosphate dehydrogenase [NAD(P)+]
MKLLREGRRAVLHGAKVGVAVRISARRYDVVRRISRAEAAERLARFVPPSRAAQEQLIREGYGPIAEQIIPIQAPFLELTATDYERLTDQIIAGWDAVQQIAATVPPASEIEGWLRRAGGPVTGAEIGLCDAEVAQGIACGHYYRNRFTVGKLSWMLGVG